MKKIGIDKRIVVILALGKYYVFKEFGASCVLVSDHAILKHAEEKASGIRVAESCDTFVGFVRQIPDSKKMEFVTTSYFGWQTISGVTNG